MNNQIISEEASLIGLHTNQYTAPQTTTFHHREGLAVLGASAASNNANLKAVRYITLILHCLHTHYVELCIMM